MGLIRGIAEAVMEKAKHEVKDYLIKFMEEEKEKEKKEEKEKKDVPVLKKDEKTIPDKKEPDTTNEEEYEEETEEEEEEEIIPLIEPEFTKISYKVKPPNFTIPSELADITRMLPVEEFACYIKLFMFVQEQKKNFGYLGNTLRKKIGLEDFSSEKFDKAVENLADYGVLKFEQVSDNQRTFILYLPFDEETMVKAEPAKQQNRPQKNKNEKKASGNVQKFQKEEQPAEKQNEHKEDLPGKAVEGMKNDDLYKSYRTFVSLEIDKAKMRVGRSNFDKIYMEAVKYIDKKYGFKVLSDSEKFKEHLTDYYISAFDILTFEQWKKTKV